MTKTKAIGAIVPWYGSNRMLAERVGKALEGYAWVGIPFAGSLCEVKYLVGGKMPRTIVAADKHNHLINLARVVANKPLNELLRERIASIMFHERILEGAQRRCQDREDNNVSADEPNLAWAVDYFICTWMARSETAGTKREFDAGMSVRWNATGGDSVVRFRNAAEGLNAWGDMFQRCTFVVQDFFEFIGNVLDRKDNAVYVDPPFIKGGERYKFSFTETDHWRMAEALNRFEQTGVVCRFYDHPKMREMYPEDRWEWFVVDGGRKQTNEKAPEVLVVKRRKDNGN